MAQKVKAYLQCNNVTQKNLIGPIELGGARFSLSIECDTGQSEEKATVGDFQKTEVYTEKHSNGNWGDGYSGQSEESRMSMRM